MDFYVYVHKKKTNGEVFYVGKGSGKRAWSAFGRNSLWKRTADKYGWLVEIVQDNLQDWYAFELERDLISYYGRRDLGHGSLTNMSDGGDGPSRLNPETLKRISEALSGLKCYKADRMDYSFYNILTKEEFKGKRVDFEKKYNLSINGLFSSRRKGVSSHFGWVVLEHLPKDLDLSTLKVKTIEGQNNPNADSKEYTFLQLNTGETFKGTRVQAKEALEINTNALFFSGTTCKGWTVMDGKTEEELYWLARPYEAGVEKRKDKSIYTFIHKSGSFYTGTRCEFKETHGIDPYHLFGKHASKSVKGWSLSPQQPE